VNRANNTFIRIKLPHVLAAMMVISIDPDEKDDGRDHRDRRANSFVLSLVSSSCAGFLQRLPSGEARALAFEAGVPSGARLAGQ
jgi:hypothetical protein